MISDFVPPNYVKVRDFLSQLRSHYFPDPKKLASFLEESEKTKFIKKGTLLNPDYKEIQKQEREQYEREKDPNDWQPPLNLTQPDYQASDENQVKFYEVDPTHKEILRQRLQHPDENNLSFPLREIVVSILTNDDSVCFAYNPPKPFQVYVFYHKTKKTFSSVDKFKATLGNYLLDSQIKEHFRNLLCYYSRFNPNPPLFAEDLSSFVLQNKKMIPLEESSWRKDDIWYRCLADGRTSLCGSSERSRISGGGDYNVESQLVFLSKYNTELYIQTLQKLISKQLNESEIGRASISPEKDILVFAHKYCKAQPQDQPESTIPDVAQTNSTEENSTPIEVAVVEQKKSTLVNLDLHHTPWLELLNHVYEIHGVDGIKTVPKKTLETTIHVYMEENDLPIDSDTDVEYLAKFIRKPEQKSGKRYYDELKKEKKLKKQA